jgi:hypothetical protein
MENGKYKEGWDHDGGIWYDEEQSLWCARNGNGIVMDVRVRECEVRDSAEGIELIERSCWTVVRGATARISILKCPALREQIRAIREAVNRSSRPI